MAGRHGGHPRHGELSGALHRDRGTAFALHEAAERLGNETADSARAAALRGLAAIRAAYDGERWGDAYELMFGNAGIGLAALRMGDAELAEAAVAPYLRTAEVTPFGWTWEQRRGQPARRHHISHGTLGIAYALAVVGTAVGRRELVDAALAGVADVVARDEAGPDGFLVPHSDPQQVAFGLERYSYGWCHGPAGDAQVFRLFAQLADGAGGAIGTSGAIGAEDASGDDWRALADRCWHTVMASGVPERLRPGFWDNSGRCCGTGGVLALACDREVENGDGLAFADVLVADLVHRATMDASGARWSNVEYRASPPELEPRPGWAMGNAGLVQRAAAARADHDRAGSALRGPVARPASDASARMTIPDQRRASERHGRAGRPDLQDPVRGRLGGGPASGALRRVGRRPAGRVHSLLRWRDRHRHRD